MMTQTQTQQSDFQVTVQQRDTAHPAHSAKIPHPRTPSAEGNTKGTPPPQEDKKGPIFPGLKRPRRRHSTTPSA